MTHNLSIYLITIPIVDGSYPIHSASMELSMTTVIQPLRAIKNLPNIEPPVLVIGDSLSTADRTALYTHLLEMVTSLRALRQPILNPLQGKYPDLFN